MTAPAYVVPDPLMGLSRAELLALHKAWFDDTVYAWPDYNDYYPVKGDEPLTLRVPTARMITNRHLGLEITSPPEFKIPDEAAQEWLGRILKLNGVRGAMRGAAVTKSWAGDVGLLFTYKPSEKDIFGTSWQVGFIEPGAYEVYSRYPSGVFKEVDIFTFEDRPDKDQNRLRRWWKRTRYSVSTIVTSPEVEGDIGNGWRPDTSAFDTLIDRLDSKALKGITKGNTLGVIPFVIIQNLARTMQDWWGASDYQNLTPLFHRINIALNTLDQGEQIRNRLMMALIDAEELDAKTANGLTVLDIKSAQDGTQDFQAKLLPTPLQSTTAGNNEDTLSRLLDMAFESAGVAQTGNAKELFGNEAASSSALKTFYSMQTAVAQHKRDNWLGERQDYGLSAFVRKLFAAAKRVDSKSPFRDVTDLDTLDYELKLDWPPMFALSAAEQQTLAAVAQQAADSGIPAKYIGPSWGIVLDATSPKAQADIIAALDKTQQLAQQGLIIAPTPSNGILGSGQGNGLGADGGDTSKVLDEVKTNDLTLPDTPKPTLSGT